MIILFKQIFKSHVLLLLIFVLAFGVRSIYFNEGLTFGYDQARDMFQALEIWTKDPIKLLGPQSDAPGLHHGSLYWYLISPFIFFSGGNIFMARLFLIFLNCVTIFFIFDLTKSLFNNRKLALLASFLFAMSFESSQYARWISNPSPAILTSTLSFWSLKQLLDGKKWALTTLLFSWGLSVQFQLFMLYQVVVFPLIWVAVKGFIFPKVSLKSISIAIIALFISVSTFIAGEIIFKMQNTFALLKLLQSHTLISSSFTQTLFTFFDRMVNVFYFNMWGVNLFLAGIITSIIFVKSLQKLQDNKNRKEFIFLIMWVVSPIVLHFFNGTNANYITLGSGVGAIILTSYFIFELLKNPSLKIWGILAIIIIVISNVNLILRINKTGEALFSVQQKISLNDELKTINWVYNEAKGKPFYVNTITNPLFINTTWAYLFNWYGRSTYGYMPIWWGETQVNVFGSDIDFSKETETDLHFLIIEPSVGREDVTEAVRHLENSRSLLIGTKSIGNFIVEKRQITKKRIFTNQDVFYQILNIDKINAEK